MINSVARMLISDTTEVDSIVAADLWARLTPEFLALISWSAELGVLVFPQGHRLLGRAACPVKNCDGYVAGYGGLCSACGQRWVKAGEPPRQEFIAIERARHRVMHVEHCAVTGCLRPWKTQGTRLCVTHTYQREHKLKLPMSTFLTHPGVVGLPSLGSCGVVACTRERLGRGMYCVAHRTA